MSKEKEKYQDCMDKNIEKQTEADKRFWNFIKPIMASKIHIAGNDISLIIWDNLTLAMNCFCPQVIFPGNTKIASVVPLDDKAKNMTFWITGL